MGRAASAFWRHPEPLSPHKPPLSVGRHEDFDKKLLTGSGIALASYAVAGAADPAKLHEAYMMRVGNARPRHAAAAAAARQRLRFASLMPSHLLMPADRAVP